MGEKGKTRMQPDVSMPTFSVLCGRVASMGGGKGGRGKVGKRNDNNTTGQERKRLKCGSLPCKNAEEKHAQWACRKNRRKEGATQRTPKGRRGGLTDVVHHDQKK